MLAQRHSRVRGNRAAAAALATLVSALVALAAVPAFASALIVVNSAGDQSGAARCEAGAGPEECTLRAAIEDVNAHLTYNPVEFSISVFDGTAGADEIQPATPLPAIAESTVIFGHTNFAAVPGPTVGVTAPAGAPALTVEASNVTVEDVAFGGGDAGIEVTEGSTGFRSEGNWFGLKLDGLSANPSAAAGIVLRPGADGARIGSDKEFDRNVFGHSASGILIEGASNAKIQGNYIGVDPAGSASAPLVNGVTIVDAEGPPHLKAENDEVGGALGPAEAATTACDGDCNVIVAEAGAGVDLTDPGAIGVEPASGPTTIRGNYLGLSADGTMPLGEPEYGVLAEPSVAGCGTGPADVTVGGTLSSEANFIDGGSVALFAEGAENFRALGNSIGLLADGNEGESPILEGIDLCSDELSEPAQIAGNKMMLGPDAIGIESTFVGAQITGNSIEGGLTGVVTTGDDEEIGNLIEGNTVTDPDVDGILLANQFNQVTGNSIAKAGRFGIELEDEAHHNRIGGDLPGEANVIAESGVGNPDPEKGAIIIFGEESSRNEIAANFGSGNALAFIQLVGHGGQEVPNGGINAPVFAAALQSSAGGTAAPNATVRIFSKASAEAGELASLLAVVKAGPTGAWTATYAKVPVGTLVAATATSEAGTAEAGTSEVSAPIAAAADPIEPVEPEKEHGGGGTNGGGTSSSSSSSSTNPPPPSQPAKPQPPKVKITKGPKKSSKATTVAFRFTATPAAGATFECKLDNAKWAKCKSPRTYRRLEPGRHTFQVRASVPGAPALKPAKFQFTVKP